ncbi:hypothetical protein EYF80_055924 [Liparis tanakae]|uniref:Uncharacterized protein n=1 Tax=Liparis tanakae TaxID=230148 RepID=A0A4Z2EZF2_9TELE|nr:hypothetical protein EYF80_055924 [Liparis tanakae]
MSRFCCRNWKYCASSRNVSAGSNFLARRKRRMKSSSVRRKPMSGRDTIIVSGFSFSSCRAFSVASALRPAWRCVMAAWRCVMARSHSAQIQRPENTVGSAFWTCGRAESVCHSGSIRHDEEEEEDESEVKDMYNNKKRACECGRGLRWPQLWWKMEDLLGVLVGSRPSCLARRPSGSAAAAAAAAAGDGGHRHPADPN